MTRFSMFIRLVGGKLVKAIIVGQIVVHEDLKGDILSVFIIIPGSLK